MPYVNVHTKGIQICDLICLLLPDFAKEFIRLGRNVSVTQFEVTNCDDEMYKRYSDTLLKPNYCWS